MNHFASPAATASTLLRTDTWTLDALGNWTTQTFASGDTNGQPESRTRWHTPDNRLSAIGNTGTSQAEATQLVYDRAGNLIFDGTYAYQYDAWNRLLQVSVAEFVSAQDPLTLRTLPRSSHPRGAGGGPVPVWRTPLGFVGIGIGLSHEVGLDLDNPPVNGPQSPGEGFVNTSPEQDPDLPPPTYHQVRLVKHFTYDGRGRLIRTLEPREAGGGGGAGVTGEAELRSTRYLYDGVRRVQEVTTDYLPDVTTLATWSLADPVVSTAATWFDGATLPLNLELRLVRGQLTAPAPPQGQTRQPITKHLTRQYIWGPGDRGLDELLVQFDQGNGLDGGKAWWPLQDAGLDLIGLCDAGGIGISSQLGTAGEARVVGQWTYDAYGRVLTADTPFALCHPKMGHKGLFVERLDESGANTSTSLISNLSSDPPTLVPRATSIVHMRNRWYRADLGRFLTVDPNASGLALIDLDSSGTNSPARVGGFAIDDLFGDGANLFGYARHNPNMYGDPSGRMVPVVIAAGIAAVFGYLIASAFDQDPVAGAVSAAAGVLTFGFIGFAGPVVAGAYSGFMSYASYHVTAGNPEQMTVGGGGLSTGLGAVFGKMGAWGADDEIFAGVTASSRVDDVIEFPRGFRSGAQYARAMDELEMAAIQAGYSAPRVGVRGSAVTGRSYDTKEPFGKYPGRSKPSDIDAWIETESVTRKVYPDKAMQKSSALSDWSRRWSSTLGYEITPMIWPKGGVPK